MYASGVGSNEKAEVAAYQLVDVTQIWYTQWIDNRALRARRISWEVYKRSFIDRFFSTEKRDAIVEEFINLRQRGMNVQEYSSKFCELYKYSSFLVSDPKDEIIQFVMGEPVELEEECRAKMLYEKMDISHLMGHAQQV